MALFKCKMCGGDLEIDRGTTVAECEYCGTKQTVPTVSDENLKNLFNRANLLRLKNEFDKAEDLYEKIIQADTTQAEAYWGLLLCRYGIEYIDDAATFKKIPTCHRASYSSITADEDYRLALENADVSQRSLYEEQATEIARIQQSILNMAKNEEKYDVFLCYKETDANGQRTHDSVIANEIYHQLTQEGYKVFYSAITLEGKLGQEYEPIIFSALNSAKIMLVIGTKPEYFNSVWVKNEWARYLRIAMKDRSKLLIPCYRDMDAYELPNEFAHLQAQDMSKIGFINDIIRGIKKVADKEDPISDSTAVQSTVIADRRATIAPHLKRAFMFIEDGAWSSADKHCEEVLNVDPECAEAYAIKLMIERKVKCLADLASCKAPLTSSKNYEKALRFGNDKYRELLESYNSLILKRLVEEKKENEYKNGIIAMHKEQFSIAISHFSRIPDYKDAAKRAAECEAIINSIKAKKEQKEHLNKKNTSISRQAALAMVTFSALLLLIAYVTIFIAGYADSPTLDNIPVALLSSAIFVVLFVIIPAIPPYFFTFISMMVPSTARKAKIALTVFACIFAAGNVATATFLFFVCLSMGMENLGTLPVPIFAFIANAAVPVYLITLAVLTSIYRKMVQKKTNDR